MSDEALVYQITDPDTEHGDPKYLVIAPQSIRVEHSERGTQQEVFHPLGVEMSLQCYACPNPACSCPDDYYVNVAVQIPKSEYDRLRAQPGWSLDTEDD